jgi:type 1 glutamine amidotransferase
MRLSKKPLVLVAAVGLIVPIRAPAAPAPPTKARVLVLSGNEYPGHHWKETAPLLAKFLANDRRLETEMRDDPNFLASSLLHDYDVVVLNYMNWESPDPGPAARANLKKFVEEGKGLVLVHFACGAFQGWPEYRQIAGRVYNAGLRPHDPYGKFSVVIADADHPVTKGLKSFETTDELYTCLDGDRPIHVVAKARSKVDKKEYPMAFINHYGKGRVFLCVLGHDTAALSVKGVQDLYRRGAAWTAGLSPTDDSVSAQQGQRRDQ